VNYGAAEIAESMKMAASMHGNKEGWHLVHDPDSPMRRRARGRLRMREIAATQQARSPALDT
jgi:hypothetical protein